MHYILMAVEESREAKGLFVLILNIFKNLEFVLKIVHVCLDLFSDVGFWGNMWTHIIF